MAHRRTPQASAELGDIWLDIPWGSGSIERADRVVDAITRRFHLIATYSHIGAFALSALAAPRVGAWEPRSRHAGHSQSQNSGNLTFSLSFISWMPVQMS